MRGDKLHEKYPQEYSCWKNMKSRAKKRGDVVGPEFERFEEFLQIMGPAPSPSHSIDQFPREARTYSAKTSRWADKLEQANNRRNTRRVQVNGVDVPLAELARQTGQNYSTLRKRVARGFSDEEVVSGRSLPTSSPPETVDELAGFRWIGSDTQIVSWRKFFLGGEPTAGGLVPWNSEELSFSEYVLHHSEVLHNALSRDDFEALAEPFRSQTPPPKGPKREALMQRLAQLAEAAFKETFHERVATDAIISAETMSSEVPWLEWIATGEVDLQKLRSTQLAFTREGRTMPPALATIWEARKGHFMHR
jgi:hypothetical protein